MTTKNHLTVDASKHPVSSVVVFRSQAEVTRSIPVELQTGDNEIDITSLPSHLLSDGLRVENAAKGVNILDHVVVTPPLPLFEPWTFGAEPRTRKYKELKAAKRHAEGKLKVLNAQAEVLMSYSKSMTSEHVNPQDFLEFVTAFQQKGNSNVEAIRNIEKEIEGIEDQMKKEAHQPPPAWHDDGEGNRKTRVKVVVRADQKVKTDLVLVYVVEHASWMPTYHIKVYTDSAGELKKSAALYYMATINQSSGEDWDDANITLDTTHNTDRNSLMPLVMLKVKPQATSFTSQNKSLFSQVPHSSFPTQATSLFGAAPVPQPVRPGFGGFGTTAPANTTGNTSSAPQPNAFGASRPPTGLFGAAPSGGTDAAPSGGLFGAASTSNTTASTTAPTTSLFGSVPGLKAPASSSASTSSLEVSVPSYPDYYYDPFVVIPDNGGTVTTRAIYKIDGKRSIPSDGQPHKVAMTATAILPLEIHVITAPRTQPLAYLQAHIKNTTKDALLGGSVEAYVDGRFVSKMPIMNVHPEEYFDCDIGVDDNVRITFKHKDQDPVATDYTFAGRTERVRSSNTITVKNGRKTNLPKVIVRDMVPVGTNPFKVLLKSPEALATLENKDAEIKHNGMKVRWSKEKPNSRDEGRIEWVIEDIKSGEEKKIELAWIVEGPAGAKWKYQQDYGY